jgi:hypothetical protein
MTHSHLKFIHHFIISKFIATRRHSNTIHTRCERETTKNDAANFKKSTHIFSPHIIWHLETKIINEVKMTNRKAMPSIWRRKSSSIIKMLFERKRNVLLYHYLAAATANKTSASALQKSVSSYQ